MTKLFLKSVQAASTVKEVDCIPVAEQMGVDNSFQICMTGGFLDDLISPLLGYATSLARGKR